MGWVIHILINKNIMKEFKTILLGTLAIFGAFILYKKVTKKEF